MPTKKRATGGTKSKRKPDKKSRAKAIVSRKRPIANAQAGCECCPPFPPGMTGSYTLKWVNGQVVWVNDD